MRYPQLVALCVSVLSFAGIAAPRASAQPHDFPPHPLWPEAKPEAAKQCEILMPSGVDASVWQTNLWAGGIVPYAIDPAVTQQNRDRLRIAMNEIETIANITFVPLTGQSNYLYVQNGGGNSSFVGQIGGAQAVNLVSWSERYVICHELYHALGQWHEQQRPDRDTYVIINQANVDPGNFPQNFNIPGGVTAEGPYNFESFMHYSRCAFSTCACPTNCTVIDPRPGYEAFAGLMGNRTYMSQGDRDAIISRYGPAIDDTFEDNDTPATAYPLPVAYSNGFLLYDTDDYFVVNQPSPGPVGFTFSAGVWSASNVTVSMLTPGGSVLASATPQDPDADGTYTAFITAQSSPGNPVIIRINRSQPWGGQYNYTTQSACVPEAWKQVASGIGPSARSGQTMAFDSARGVAVMFGGDSSGTVQSDTWTWNGNQWTARQGSGPSARVHAASAFDTARGRVVLFGGRSGNTFLNDTWEWDGTSWTQRTLPNPPGVRAVAGMTYDSVRSRIVLFGGVNSASGGGQLGDTWEYDGTAWVQRSSVGPPAREWPMLAFDPTRQRTVLFGGGNGSAALNDTWEWNGAVGTWSQRPVAGPSARASKNLVFDPIRGVCVLFSGYAAGQFFADQWEFNGTVWSQRALVTPQARYSHSVVWDSVRQVLLSFGGETASGAQNADLWSFNGTTWLPIAGPQQPSARGRNAMVGDARLGAALMFGGGVSNGSTVSGDTWVNSRGVWGRYADGNAITPRQTYAMAYDSARQRTVLYGGETFSTIHASTFEFGPQGWVEPLTAVTPGQRSGPSMAFDAARGACVLFGGTDFTNYPTTTWSWNGTAWTQAAATGPSGRWLASMAYLPSTQRVVLFGGRSSAGTSLDDTWLWNGVSWSQLNLPPLASPVARYSARMNFDPLRGTLILQGGSNGTTRFNDTWEFNGLTWNQVATAPFAPRENFAMGLDPATQRLLTFGGLSGSTDFSDTWRFDSIADAPAFTAQPQNATVNAGTQAVFNAPATDAGAFTYRWYATTNNAGVQGSVALSDLDRSGRILGVFTNQLRINSAQTSDATTQPVPGVFVNRYFCLVTNACQSASSTAASLTVNTPPPACVGDLSGDNVVNVVDLTIFLGAFGTAVPPGTGADFDANGVVNVVDLTIFLGRFGQSCP
jgi:hypothetical protein